MWTKAARDYRRGSLREQRRGEMGLRGDERERHHRLAARRLAERGPGRSERAVA